MKRMSRWGMITLCAALLTGCGEGAQSVGTQPVSAEGEQAVGESSLSEERLSPGTGSTLTAEDLNVYLWDEAVVYEAEDAEMLGAATASGDHAEGLVEDGDGVRFHVTVETDGFYDLAFAAMSGGSYKENHVLVDGESMGNIVTESSQYEDSCLNRVWMAAGDHTIDVTKFWGWIQIDKLRIKPSDDVDPAIYRVSYELVNPDASEEAKRLFSYLADNYGNHIISGQYCDTGMLGSEVAAVAKATDGIYPAILGLDFIEYSPSRVANGSVGMATEQAIAYWQQGGIVTFCWHWNAPEKYLTGQWYSGFYKDYTNIDLAKIMDGQDPEGYELLMADIDAIAEQLTILRDAGVPILWRPLHEAAGGWFWWGAAGADAYKKLYVLLYDRLTNEYGLNNLIWIWNGQDADWYPGDAYVDIIGEDLYPGERVYTPQTAKFYEAVGYTDAAKMVVMSENGCVFDPEIAARDGAWWGFFCTWQREFVRKDTAIVAYSEQYTEAEALKRFYQSELVITRDELPDLTTYPIAGGRN